jgi:uncharacterized protein (DUF169 family)
MTSTTETVDYAASAAALTSLLGLSGSPVAIRFAATREAIPEGIEEVPETIRHCGMVSLARKEGKIFYATADKHLCNGGAWSLGLRPITQSLKDGEFYYKLGKFESDAACKRTIDQIPHLEPCTTYATMYAPLGKTPFIPHVIMIVANPFAMLKLAQASLYHLGGRLHPSFAGIQSVCADVTALTYLSGEMNISLGCDGSRKFSGIAPDELVMGFPAERLDEIVDALKIVCAAPGSQKK